MFSFPTPECHWVLSPLFIFPQKCCVDDCGELWWVFSSCCWKNIWSWDKLTPWRDHRDRVVLYWVNWNTCTHVTVICIFFPYGKYNVPTFCWVNWISFVCMSFLSIFSHGFLVFWSSVLTRLLCKHGGVKKSHRLPFIQTTYHHFNDKSWFKIIPSYVFVGYSDVRNDCPCVSKVTGLNTPYIYRERDSYNQVWSKTLQYFEVILYTLTDG